MTQNEFSTYIENLNIFDRLQGKIQNLQIDWQLDISKIDLSVLASGQSLPTTPGTTLKIEFIEVKNIFHNSNDLFLEGNIERILELLKLIENGVKIIPPLIHKSIEYVDSEIKQSETVYPITISDGEHRIRLSKHLGLDQIPLLVIETPFKYYFSKSLWNMELKGDTIEMTQKNGEKICRLPLLNSHGRLTVSGDYLFFIH